MNYLQPHTLGSIIRSSFAIYFGNFLTVFIIYAIPLIPLQLIRIAATATDEPPVAIAIVFILLETMAGILVIFPATIAVSEVCLGMKPTVARSYSRAFASPGRLIGTYLLQMLVIIGGLLLLVIPGIIFSVWYFFVGPVVLVESLSGKAALRRSRELGKDYYLRNFGVYFVVVLIVIVANGIIGAIVGALVGGLSGSRALMLSLIMISTDLVTPIFLVAIVLLYYDMRARKEGYGAAQLSEDLRL
jgi:hypothetical protein